MSVEFNRPVKAGNLIFVTGSFTNFVNGSIDGNAQAIIDVSPYMNEVIDVMHIQTIPDLLAQRLPLINLSNQAGDASHAGGPIIPDLIPTIRTIGGISKVFFYYNLISEDGGQNHNVMVQASGDPFGFNFCIIGRKWFNG